MKSITPFLVIACYFCLSLAIDSLPQATGQTVEGAQTAGAQMVDDPAEDKQTQEDKPSSKQQPQSASKAEGSAKASTNSAATQTDAGSAENATAASAAPVAEAPQAPKKTFELTFDDLAFEMEKGSKFERSLLTEKINSYDNNVIKVRGYIRPSFSQSGLKKFIFVRDNKECCFGPGAALYDCILVRLAKGAETDFTVRPVTIQGTFSLKEYQGPDGKVWSIYRMNDTKMK